MSQTQPGQDPRIPDHIRHPVLWIVVLAIAAAVVAGLVLTVSENVRANQRQSALQPFYTPLVLVCIGQASWTHDLVTQAPGFGVHILAADQEEVSNTFAFSREDRFKDLPWEGGHHGVPMLEGAHARLVCERHQVVEAGDHSVLIGRVLQADVTDGDPLMWWKGGYRRLAE